MNQLSMQENFGPAYPREQRKNDRYREMYLLVITSRGTGKILDIGNEGLSFGCLYHHDFPAIWSMDIIDARGIHLKQLSVRKIWERSSGRQDLSGSFELEIGVEFMDLSPQQENDLNLLLNNQIPIDYQPASLL